MRRLLAIILGSYLFLGCCSAWRPAAQGGRSGAEDAIRSGEYAKAREIYEATLKSNPEDVTVQKGLLALLRMTGAYDEAIRRADAFVLAGSKQAGLFLERGRTRALKGDSAEAEKDFRTALGLGTESRAAASAALGLLLEGIGREEEARSLWEGLVADYRGGRTAPADLGQVALAAWHLGWAQDAKDVFLDATGGENPDVDTLNDFGFLFLEKYNATDAMGVFRDALKARKNDPVSLVGMALAKKFESNDQAEAFGKAALEVNPNLVAALNLLAELRIQEEDYTAASDYIRRALEVNPRDLESLSLEAVHRHFRGDMAGFAEIEKRILAIHPAYGRLYYTLAGNLVMRRKYQEAVTFNRKAVELDPDLYAAWAELGINLMRLGDIPAGREAVQKAFDGDPYNVWAFNTLDLLDQMDKYTTSSSEHFIYRMAQEDSGALSRYAPGLAEEAFARLTERYGFTPQGPLHIELFPDHAGFAVRTLGLPGLGALGVCFGKVIAMDSPRAQKPGSFNWGSTLWHEFAHVITLQMTRHNIPRWYSEGLSVYEERRARPGWGDDLSLAFLRAYAEGKLLKVSELNQGMMRPKFPEQIALSYYQASLVCEMIEEKFGFTKIKESLQLFANDLGTEEVFLRALGWDRARVDLEYARFVEERMREKSKVVDFKRLSEQKGRTPDADALRQILKQKPDDFFAALQLGTVLRKEKSYAEAETLLKHAHALFPEYVEHGNPYQVLSDMYLEQNREEDALREILAWTSYDENAAAPLVRASEILRKKGDWRGAADVLERSIYIQPFDAEVHNVLGEAALKSGKFATAAAAFQVLLSLNPSDPATAHLNLARSWLGIGKRDVARREVLRALEIAPHFEEAQRLLLDLRERRP